MNSSEKQPSTSLSTHTLLSESHLQSPNARCRKRVRIGIDVGGTFTKAVVMDSTNGAILAVSTVPTTHHTERGVSDGILTAFGNVVQDTSIKLDDIDLVAHSTTQSINTLLENDTYPVGIIAMGVGLTKKDVVKRTKLDGGGDRNIFQKRDSTSDIYKGLKTYHEFLDTSHLITKEEVRGHITHA